MWPQIIGAGISMLGSLFGKDDEPQVTTTEVDYVKMAKNAEKAGFNPLTAIRNGGSAGFVTTTHPALSSAGGWGEAFSTLGNALMSFDFNAERRSQLETKMMEIQLARMQRPTDGFTSMMFGDVPTAMAATRVGASGRPVAPDGLSPGSALPAFKWVYVTDRDGSNRREIRVPNIDVMPDDPSGLLVPGLAEGGEWLEEQFGGGGNVNRNQPGQTRMPYGPKKQATVGDLLDLGADAWRWMAPNFKPQGNPSSAPKELPAILGDPFATGWTPKGW